MTAPTFSRLTLTIATILASTSAFAAGLDRSGQDTKSFFQDGTYAEAVYTYINADVSGHDNALISNKNYSKGQAIDDISEDYDFFRWGIKSDVNDRISVGVIYDEPWGAAVKHTGNSHFVSNAGDADSFITSVTQGNGDFTSYTQAATAFTKLKSGAQQAAAGAQQAATQAASLAAQAKAATDPTQAAKLAKQAATAKTQAEKFKATAQDLSGKATALAPAVALAKNIKDKEGQGTNVEIRSNSVSGLVGYKFGENKNIQVYGGPVAQRLTGELKLRGAAYGASTGYDYNMSSDTDFGWLGGVSYSKPEIGLKASLTYRSEIDHTATVDESVPFVSSLPDPTQEKLNALAESKGKGKINITTPESINVDFQTGINPTTLLTANVRYVPWSDFSITPPEYNALTTLSTKDTKGLPIANYSDDQWKVELGVAKRVSPKLAVSGNVGWDSGAGNPTSSLGPVEGYYSLGLGAKYNVTENWAVSAGAKYLMFGDAKASLPTGNIVGNFTDNDGIIAGIKLSYQQK